MAEALSEKLLLAPEVGNGTLAWRTRAASLALSIDSLPTWESTNVEPLEPTRWLICSIIF